MKDRVVVKVGSNVLTRQDGSLDITMISSIVDQIVELRKMNYDVVLVTSGAVACGRKLFKKTIPGMEKVSQRQLFSAMGQVRLMDLYFTLFKDHGYNIGQVLTMKENFEPGRQYDNQKNCIEVMIENGVIPIINENDTVSITELMFTDNDELSGLVAKMVNASILLLLTSVDGIYDGNPSKPESKVIRVVRVSDDISSFIRDEKSEFGRGGMLTKCNTAREIASSGVKVIIANGRRENVVVKVINDPESILHTEFCK